MKNEFIKIDTERILSEIILSYEKITGVNLNPADTEMLMVDCMAYREIVLRTLMNDAMSNNFVQLAAGESLDMWGGLFGTERKEDESDDDFRERIMLANRVNIGTIDAYKARILSVNDIVGAKILTQANDKSIAPGSVVVTALQAKDKGGDIPDDSHKQQIIATLNDNSYAILGAKVTYKEPIAVPINGTIVIMAEIYGEEQAKAEAKEIVDSYIAELSTDFSARFKELALTDKLLEPDNAISKITDMDFSVKLLEGVEYYTLGTITINV